MSAPLFFMAPGAPTPVAPFSHAVEVDDWIFVTGQMPTWPDDDGRALAPDIEGQTVRVMENLKIVLAGLKLGLEHAVCVRIYLTDFEGEYERMNKVYAGYFPADRRPARTCIGVTGLARGAKVEIDLLAKRG
jgi:2-iminobutanoate/2-iminopropanoate deaminase